MKKTFYLLLFALLLFSCDNDREWKFQGDTQKTDDVLTLKDKSSSASIIEEYKNLELTLECKTTENAIAGIFVHSKDVSEDGVKGGYEILINNNFDSNEWRKSGSLSAVRNFGKRTANNNEWFPVRIQITGKQIKVYINNVWVTDYTEPENPFRTEEYLDRLFDKGNIAFFNYTDNEVSFRNIKIKKLDDNLQSDNSSDIDEQTDDIIRLHQQNFPLIDSHVHLKGGWTKEQAAAESRRIGITYGIAPNCGLKFPVTTDQDIYNFLDTMQHQPFFLPMQAEGREWLTLFTEEAMSKFDYRFTDALTWTDNKGRRQRIWIPEETFIDNDQQFMDILVDRAVEIISNEPVQIFVNPTFIPQELQPRYEELWTEKRMQRIIDACLKSNVALEINNYYKIPSARLIKQAKAAGVKFTFGTNNVDTNIGKMEYSLEMIKECNLTPSDLYIPPSKNI